MDTTISTTSSEGGECNPRDTAKCGCRLGLCKNDNGWETSATPGQGATPALPVPLLSLRVQAIVDGERVAEGEYAMALDDLRQSNYLNLAERATARLGRQIGELLRATTPAEMAFRVDDARHARELVWWAREAEVTAAKDRIRTLEADLAAANRTWSVRVSVPNDTDHHCQIDTTLIDIGHSDRVYIVESDEISRAFAERDAANARVATLEAECVAWREVDSKRDMSGWCEDNATLDRLIAARAATGPIGGVA